MHRLSVMAAFALGAFSGCGGGVERPAVAPTGGQVLLDGKPVAGASVSFVPASGGRLASGVTDAEGRFKLTTFEPEDGALVGEHSVGITLVKTQYPPGFEVPEDGTMPAVDFSQVKTEWVVPQKYSKPSDSGLRATVPAEGTDSLKFELTSK